MSNNNVEDIDKQVLRKYELVQRLGRGAYGVVWKAVYRKNGQTVALKKCFDAFQNSTDAQRTFREVMYLQALHGQPNIIEIQNVLKAENDRDLYIVTDFMESDLHAAIKSNILLDIHKQYITYQLLRALKYIHSGDLIHRDIKPSNILLNADCCIKLCDFGLARSVMKRGSGSFSQPAGTVVYSSSSVFSNAVSSPSVYSSSSYHPVGGPIMTDYIATRWYRSPEILVGSTQYTKGVDIWAVGCILGEMILGRPVFTGTSTLDQLEKIIKLIGAPSVVDMESLTSKSSEKLIKSIMTKRSTSGVLDGEDPWVSYFPGASDSAIDFMQQCFRFNPNRRPSADALLAHPFLTQFRDPPSEKDCKGGPIRIPLDDNVKLTADDYRTRIYDLIVQKKRENKALQGSPYSTASFPVVRAPTLYSKKESVVTESADNRELTPSINSFASGGSRSASKIINDVPPNLVSPPTDKRYVYATMRPVSTSSINSGLSASNPVSPRQSTVSRDPPRRSTSHQPQYSKSTSVLRAKGLAPEEEHSGFGHFIGNLFKSHN